MLSVLPVKGLPIIKQGDDFGNVLLNYFTDFEDGDVLVVAHTVISRAEGKEIDLETVKPCQFAEEFAKRAGKDPRVVEVVLQESRSIVRMSRTLLITETKHGFVCANSGVDRSNAHPGHVIALPDDPDMSAWRIQKTIWDQLHKTVGVVISDTFGRPLRVGTTNIAVGVAGFHPIHSYKGRRDLFGHELLTTEVCVADELATTAGLVMGQSSEGVPAAVVRGWDVVSITPPTDTPDYTATIIPRTQDKALFW